MTTHRGMSRFLKDSASIQQAVDRCPDRVNANSMWQLLGLALGVILVIAILALARVITNWFVDRG